MAAAGLGLRALGRALRGGAGAIGRGRGAAAAAGGGGGGGGEGSAAGAGERSAGEWRKWVDSELEGSPPGTPEGAGGRGKAPPSPAKAGPAATATAAPPPAAAAAAGGGGGAEEGAKGLPGGGKEGPPTTPDQLGHLPGAVREIMKREGYAPLAGLPSERPPPQFPRGAQGPALLRRGRDGRDAGVEAPPDVPRIHPWKMHFPGVHYDAEDLDPYGEAEEMPLWLRKKQMQLRNRRRQQAAKGEVAPNFKEVRQLERFVTAEKRIKPRRYSGLDGKQQRRITRAVKTARSMALLRYPGMHKD